MGRWGTNGAVLACYFGCGCCEAVARGLLENWEGWVRTTLEQEEVALYRLGGEDNIPGGISVSCIGNWYDEHSAITKQSLPRLLMRIWFVFQGRASLPRIPLIPLRLDNFQYCRMGTQKLCLGKHSLSIARIRNLH